MTEDRDNGGNGETEESRHRSVQTGVLDTEGSGLHHTDASLSTDSGPGDTPVDVDRANSLADEQAEGLARDLGSGGDTTGAQP